MVEKLAKALEGLKNIQFTTSVEDTNISKKEKMFFCVLAADVMVSIKTVNTPNLAAAMENMINLCDDKDSDVRMVAEESLNRIIMSLSEANMLKVQLELHKIIKKNGPARCVRAALTRFGQLSHCIRPHKGRGHVQVLIPSLIEIAKREEESVHETLASSFEQIFRVLGIFVQDNSLKGLIKAFLHNLSSTNPVIRRCSASCIITIIQYCRKPHLFNSYVLNSLLDCVVPICEENSTDLILGILGCLRLLLPTLSCVRNDEGISGSFGLRRRQEECLLSVDRLIQAYELCLHYTNSKDHNVVAAALETLNQILQNPPRQLETFFLSPAGFSRSYIHSMKENKLWSRSGSEMSIACSLAAIDESLLLDDNDISSQFSTFSAEEQFESKQASSRGKDRFVFPEDDVRLIESPFKDKLPAGKTVGSQGTVDIDSDTESTATSELNAPSKFLLRVETEDVEDFDDCSRSNSQDDLYSPSEGERFCPLTSTIDVGNFTDTAVPLIHCARHLTASFLLEGTANRLKSDRTVRVSIKSLALSCISAIIKLYPVVMKMTLGKNYNDFYNQEISDILLYSSHSDPQIRGCVSNLVGCFMDSALSESKGFTSDWLSDKKSRLNSEYLIDIILMGLKDKYSVCTRQALSAVKLCLHKGLYSVYSNKFLSLLEYLPPLRNNSYWLVKVKLTEVLADLPYVCLFDLSESNLYQEEVVDSVLLPLLGDEDSRVRLAAAEALVKIIRVLYHGKSTVMDFTKPFTTHLNKWFKTKLKLGSNLNLCPPFSYLLMDPEEFRFDENIEVGLSRIVAKLTFSLLVPENKHFLFGYIEALKLMSQEYPPTVYSKGWNCWKEETEKSGENDFLTSSLITVVFSLVVTSPLILDLSAFSNATLLLGNLFAGLCIFHLKKGYQVSSDSVAGESIKLWDVFSNEQFSQIAEEILTHLLRVLNIYSGLVEEVTLSNVSDTSTVNAFLPLLSPIKKSDKKGEERADDKKSKNSNRYKQTTQYAKLHHLLKNVHTNYKVSLDKSVGDKFLHLLESNLYTLSVLLEVATVQETGRCAEEILSYLRASFSLRACPTVISVIQLLKSLFGTNLACNWEDGRLASIPFHGVHLFDSVFHLPTEFLSDKIRRRVNLNSLECENLTGFSRRTERKVLIKNTDKNSLGIYIRLFEPMVVKSLQLYTITGDVNLQLNVLRLLNQLVQLRVNYCLMDERQVFVGFVLSQFELIEHGQLPGIEELLPHIFKFLVLLSYQKQHSKPIISIPKIMQLCDGLMASDQSIQTHCIPALSPVVEDIFLSRNLVSSVEEKELETQREVLISMLLRLVEFPRVMDLLTSILNESKKSEEKERWKRWSRQVVDAVFPLANQDRLRIETFEGQNSFVKLMSSLSVNALRPIDSLLKALFVEPSDYNCITSLNRWLSRVTVLLETILIVKEHALLSKLEEISPNINLAALVPTGNLFSPDPFNVKSFFQVYDAAETAARFIVKVISIVASKILECVSSSFHLQQKLSIFFVCVFHLIKSGAFHRITNALQSLMSNEPESLAIICSLFQRMMHVCPMLTSQFSYFLALSNYCDLSFWAKILDKPSTLPAKLVQSCGIIALSDYLCDNLSDTDTLRYLLANNAKELVIFSHEIPTKELLVTVHKRKSDWILLADRISSKSFHLSEPRHVEKLLRFLEISDNCHSGALLGLLINKFLGSPRLALSLLAGSIACRQVEFLLTLPKEKILELIDARRFSDLIDFFKDERYSRRHLTLWGLLTKLGVKAFDLSLSELKPPQGIDTEQLKNVQLNELWYFNQVKQRCCQINCNDIEIPCLLRKLSYEKIVEIMLTPQFNISVLRNCLDYSKISRENFEWHDPDFEQRKSLDASELNALQKASKSCLFRLVGETRESLLQAQRDAKAETITDRVVEEIFRGENFFPRLMKVAECLTFFLETLYSDNSDVENEDLDGVFHFGLLCFEVIRLELEKQKMEGKRRIHSKNLISCLKCCSAVVKSRKVGNLLSETSKRDALNRLMNNIFCVLSQIIPHSRFSTVQKDEHLIDSDELDHLGFLLGFVLDKANDASVPDYLLNCVRDLMINVCRTPELSSRILKVPETSDIQDIEVLENFILKFSVIGWSSKQQFEEIWVALLSVLGFNAPENIPWEENGFITQASAAAVEGITTLLKDTLMDFGRKKLIRHGRDSLSMKNVFPKLPLVKKVYESYDFSDRAHHFLDNLEISRGDDRYVPGQLSVEYLWTAVKQISSRVNVHEKHSEDLSAIGLDLPSCIHFLTELYNQWLYQPWPDIRIITSSLKSSLVISDMFTDIAQFQWLLNFCFRVNEIVIGEDTVILPLIILGVCKAGAIVLPNNEVCEKIKKIMVRSKNLPCRLAATRGILYLLQSYIVSYAVNHTAVPPVGSAFQTEEANFVANIVDTFLPVALDFVQQFKLEFESDLGEYDSCHWSLIFYLLQHYHSSLGNLKDEFINFIVHTLHTRNCSNATMALLIRGIERLLLTTVIDENLRDQLSKISLDIISSNSVTVACHGLQLLTVLSFLEKRVKDIRQSVINQDDPEKIMKDMEKINVLFEKLKKSYPKEAEIVGKVISYVLMDFTASDVLTKVIQEFLSSHQPHQKILGGLLFKVFERAELSLLEDWVVFSLPSFIQGLPIAMSVWTLSCFFVSASSEPWLRSMFPLVLSRMRMAQLEDKKLLCLSAAHFYKQLKQESQRKSFVQTFENATKIDKFFLDLLSSLQVVQ